MIYKRKYLELYKQVHLQRKGSHMKLKAVVTEGINPSVSAGIESPSFLQKVFQLVLGKFLNVKNPTDRPAEFYAQLNDVTVALKDGCWGVEVRLTGATYRADRDFQGALNALFVLYRSEIQSRLGLHERVQLFCVIMVGEEGTESSGAPKLYESEAIWVCHPTHGHPKL